MRIQEVVDERLLDALSGGTVIGIDIGSRTGKAVLLSGEEIYTSSVYTGINMQETADELLEDLLDKSGLTRSDIDYIVGTGYGRVALRYPDIPTRIVTEISCHAMGAHYLNADVRTIVDIGGQDSKAIRVDPLTGGVTEFVMNDKCAAGTGRFLEKVAEILELSIDELGQEAVLAEAPSEISSQCVVFAESEVISLRARGETRRNIAAGIHFASAKRVRNLLKRVGIEPGLIFSGGVSNNVGMRKALEELSGHPLIEAKIDTIFAGALGAAIHALNDSRAALTDSRTDSGGFRLDLSGVENRIAERQEQLSAQGDEHKKVGYLCSYTPLELISAAGVSHIRLFKAGDTETVASGEQITQSVFCDFTKSILGAFKEKDPLYTSLDKVYTFYTCDCIKTVGEAIGEFFTPTDIYTLPRIKAKPSSRDFYGSQILSFKADLEQLSGNVITEDEVRLQIRQYNEVRRLLTQISELRKRPNPPLTGKDYLDLIKAFYYLPAEELIPLYRGIYDKLSAVPIREERTIRLFMAGGIIADGDRKLLELIEDELGARIVAEDHCTGLKIASAQIDETGDPYKALAEGYIDQTPCARMKPLEERVNLSGALATEYQVDGILYAYLKFCPCYGQVKNEFFRHYQQLGLPVLELPIDYSKSDQGQLKTRLEAFIEVLKERKGLAAGAV
ncbi:2-hydroxyacyl-CoA dehydratase [Paenibacillus sp. HN-1]|uniref:2-hydroxyacyl-CoA dehydratase n=1 Tax=Paenibacillus TaxID=44249 RepID=UPI001CA87219|nr:MULTISPECIES: 2-hydroxyacyl-CoA dehydratase [Paenibacillus]MBY9081094.1 2-hydroxyacyl-CoA dehydratase [Paenibacillus sp. CGMCC 1.18879]MBY9087131.1 2-hydroxyacyl-CoA dehydratase [Paenibacillus sinensis]